MEELENYAINTAGAIYAYLLKHKKLTRQSDKELYDKYDADSVKQVVDILATNADCKVTKYADTIYIMPNVDNTYIGYTNAELKKYLCKGYKGQGTHRTPPQKFLYLSNFIIIVLLKWFYCGTSYATSKISSDSYIRVGELIQKVSEELEACLTTYSESEQELYGTSFKDISDAWESLKSDTGSKNAGTRQGYLHYILKFMDNQDLLHYAPERQGDDVRITTTKKLDDMMDNNILSCGNNDCARWNEIISNAVNTVTAQKNKLIEETEKSVDLEERNEEETEEECDE